MTTSPKFGCVRCACYSLDVGGVETSFFGYAQDYRLSQQRPGCLVLVDVVFVFIFLLFYYFKLTETLNHTWFAVIPLALVLVRENPTAYSPSSVLINRDLATREFFFYGFLITGD